MSIESASPDDVGRARHLALPYTSKHEIDERQWRKLYKLDEGCVGEVWLSELNDSTNSGRSQPVAIKCLSETGRTLEMLRVLCSELKIMMFVQQLGSHPNIITFLGASTKYFQKMEVNILMEFCPNGSLKKYIEKHQLDLFQAVDNLTENPSPQISVWCYQIALGMQFLSSNGILHIDLAARNILLTKSLVAKVGDFGLSRNMYGNPVYKRREVGLPQLWAAPEALEDNVITVKSDIWSYGVTVWEILSKGSNPSYGGSDVIQAIKRGTRLPKPLSATVKTYELLLTCWDLSPTSRPDYVEIIAFFQNQSQQTHECEEVEDIQTMIPNVNQGPSETNVTIAANTLKQNPVPLPNPQSASVHAQFEMHDLSNVNGSETSETPAATKESIPLFSNPYIHMSSQFKPELRPKIERQLYPFVENVMKLGIECKTTDIPITLSVGERVSINNNGNAMSRNTSNLKPVAHQEVSLKPRSSLNPYVTNEFLGLVKVDDNIKKQSF